MADPHPLRELVEPDGAPLCGANAKCKMQNAKWTKSLASGSSFCIRHFAFCISALRFRRILAGHSMADPHPLRELVEPDGAPLCGANAECKMQNAKWTKSLASGSSFCILHFAFCISALRFRRILAGHSMADPHALREL